MRKLSRKDRAICILIVVVVVGCAAVARYLPPAIAYWRSSEVYKRYSHVEGVRATYIQDFHLNDTLTVCVTLLEATDSAGWERLIESFNITQEMRTVFEQIGSGVMSWNSPRGNPEVKAATIGEYRDVELTDKDIEICACSFNEHKICVFHTQNEEEILAIDNYNYDNMINQTNILNYEENEN